jgi:hypothetical protein
MYYYNNKNKYNNSKVTFNGEAYDSRKEAKRHQELLLLQRAGEIKDLQRQVKFELIPTQREPDTIGKRGGVHKGKVIENNVNYIADFVYTDCRSGEKVVEDSKGMKTEKYIIKRKLMLYIHGIRILET